ncbi:hypothetical protein [Marinicella litoralis]|uniref:hypothetical protein n=1 Tax=Marinicella litoralis TaxID=644220 RepID=UPI0013C32504|nr:hypothetical protein [Marinicella litoralis]
MKSKDSKQAEIPFKPTEFQLDLLVGQTSDEADDLQFFPSKNCLIKAKTKSKTSLKPKP